jgi:omega-hydroxy-beta-dihydromenaquinone-9 sulfotransferase
MSPANNQPIFIVGTGRSGSTIFFEIFSKHPNVAWLSKLSRENPGRPWVNRLYMYALGVPLMENLLAKHCGPAEAYPFWDFNCPGFSNPCRDLDADDVTPLAAARLRDAIGRTVTARRYRFLAKITGWPRMRYLSTIFPEALFVEVTRHPCAVASSLLEVYFWDGWRGPPNWRRGELPPDLAALWHEEGKSFVALAGIEHVMLERAMRKCRQALAVGQIHTVTYARLCADPVSVMKEVTDFCHLKWHGRFEDAIKRVPLSNKDDKWRSSLTPQQQTVLLRTFERARELDP